MHLSFANLIQQSHSLHSDFYDEIAKPPIDLFFKEELSCEEFLCDNLYFPQKEFHFLNACTYFSLYPDIFGQGAMHSSYFDELNSTWLQSYEDLHLEY